MPKRTQLTEAEREQRRAADRAFVQQAVEQLPSSEGWQSWGHHPPALPQLLPAYVGAVRVSVAALVRSDVGDMSLMGASLRPFVVLCAPAGNALAQGDQVSLPDRRVQACVGLDQGRTGCTR